MLLDGAGNSSIVGKKLHWSVSSLGGQYPETSGDLLDDITDGDALLRLHREEKYRGMSGNSLKTLCSGIRDKSQVMLHTCRWLMLAPKAPKIRVTSRKLQENVNVLRFYI